MVPPNSNGGKKFQQICFHFLTKGLYNSLRIVNRNRELIPNSWRSHRESVFANIQLRFWNKTLFGIKQIKAKKVNCFVAYTY